MMKFSKRINADWNSPERLEELLDEFFMDDNTPKTDVHLHTWLNSSYMEMSERMLINEEYSKLITAAYNLCEMWIVEHGFDNDRSFARWYLENHRKKNQNEEIITGIRLIDA